MSASAAEANEALLLADWRRRVFELYRRVREDADPAAAWRRWRDERDELFAHHAQSPLPAEERAGFAGLPYFDHDPSARVLATVAPAERTTLEIATSGESPYRFTRVGKAVFELGGERLELELYWLEGYGGGLYLPFADATSGEETYAAGRYMELDPTATGIYVVDFNGAYHPFCYYNEEYDCPFPPAENRLDIPIRAGERMPAGTGR